MYLVANITKLLYHKKDSKEAKTKPFAVENKIKKQKTTR